MKLSKTTIAHPLQSSSTLSICFSLYICCVVHTFFPCSKQSFHRDTQSGRGCYTCLNFKKFRDIAPNMLLKLNLVPLNPQTENSPHFPW